MSEINWDKEFLKTYVLERKYVEANPWATARRAAFFELLFDELIKEQTEKAEAELKLLEEKTCCG